MAGEKEAKVIAAATQVFLRYGFRRATMGDIAEAARISRRALYLVFPSKEVVFTAVTAWLFTAALDEIRQGLVRFATAEEKLAFAFEAWCVRPFEIILASPDATDLPQSSYEFATDVTTKAAADFEALLAEVLQPQVRRESSDGIVFGPNRAHSCDRCAGVQGVGEDGGATPRTDSWINHESFCQASKTRRNAARGPRRLS